jgi:hypothetical protein
MKEQMKKEMATAAGVAKELLDAAQVRSAVQEVRSVAVTQLVRAHPELDRRFGKMFSQSYPNRSA